jgi:predicted MFS family arabinose efflux permease
MSAEAAGALAVVAPEPQRRWTSVVLIVLCQSMQALAFGGIGLFLPLIRDDLGLSFAEAGTLGAASTLVYALMQIPSGYLADRVGPKRLFLIGLVGTNVLTFTFAELHDYGLLVVNQALSGFFRALVFAPGLLLVAALFPVQRRATAMGLYIAGGFSSSIFLNSIGPLLVKPLGWQRLFELFAVGGLVVLVLYWRLGAPGPRRAGSPPPLRSALRLFRYRTMWLLGVVQYVRLAVVFGLAFWLPSFLVDERGLSLRVAGLVLAVGSLLTAPSNFLGGYASDRLRNPQLVIGASLAMLAVTIVLLVHVHELALLVLVIAINAIFVQLYFGPLFSLGVEMLGVERAGLASGFGNFFANLGGFTFTYTLGALKDATGSFTVGFYTLAGLCIVGLAATVALAHARPVTG